MSNSALKLWVSKYQEVNSDNKKPFGRIIDAKVDIIGKKQPVDPIFNIITNFYRENQLSGIRVLSKFFFFEHRPSVV